MKQKICDCFDIPFVALVLMIVILILFMKLGFKVQEISERRHPVFAFLASGSEEGK